MKLIGKLAPCLVAIAFALGVATTASAQEVNHRGLLDPDSLFVRGRMSVFAIDGFPLEEIGYGGPVFEIFASGNGTASVEVYDATDMLLGTVTGKLTLDPDPDNFPFTFLALTVTINRVDASGVNGCDRQFNEMVCDLVVPTPATGMTTSASLRLVASVRGNVDVADFVGGLFAEGQGYGEASFVHTAQIIGPAPPPI